MPELEAFCDLPFKHIKVRPNGDVNMCCYQSGSLGNLLQQDFREIWLGTFAKEVRAWTLASHLHKMCKGWGGCPFLVKERLPRPIRVNTGWPTSLEFDLPNTHCNVGGTSPTPETACFMCPRAAPDFQPSEDLTSELIDRLKFLMPYLTEIRVQGTAEPFWKDRLFQILDQLGFEDYKQRCMFSTYTNGTIFDEQRRTRFRDLCPLAALFFSLDAATPETYTKVRRLSAFGRVVENIRNFVREKRPTQRVDIANNLNMVNLHEAVQMVELGKDLGVDNIQFNPTHDGGGVRHDLDPVRVGPSNYRLFAEAQKAILKRAAELGVRVTIVRPLDLNLSAAQASKTGEQFTLYSIAPRAAPPITIPHPHASHPNIRLITLMPDGNRYL